MQYAIRVIVFVLGLVFLNAEGLAFQPPKNNLKSNAQLIELGPNGNYFSKNGEFTSVGATGEQLYFQGWGDMSTRSVWFKFVAPVSDKIIITVTKTELGDPASYIQLGIIDGETPVEAKAFGYPIQSEQLITSDLIAGKSYFLIVDNPESGNELAAFDLSIQTVLITACAIVQTVALNAKGTGELNSKELFNDDCYWPCSGVGCTRELSQTKFKANQLGDNYVTVKGLASNGKAYFGTLLVKVIDTIPPTIVAKDFRINITENGKAVVNPLNVISWRCKKTASEPMPNPTPDQGDDWFFQEIPCAKDNVAIERFELSKTVFTCNDLGENEVIATVTDASGNKASTKVKITVFDLTPLVVKAKSVQLYLDQDGLAILNPESLNDGSTSGCSGFESAANKTTFDFNNLGKNKVSYIIKNNRGDMASQEVTVTVVDTIPPTVVVQEVTMFANMKGTLTINSGNSFVKLCPEARIVSVNQKGGLSPDGAKSEMLFEQFLLQAGCTKDNGQIFEIWIGPNNFTSKDIGVNEVEVFVSDMAGNTTKSKSKLTLIEPKNPCKQQLWAIASGDWNDPNIWSDKPNGKSIGAIPCNNTVVNIKGFNIQINTDEIIEVETIRLLNAGNEPTELNIYIGQLNLKQELYLEKNIKVFKHTQEALRVIKK
jgi:hypothetical protein